MNAEADAFRASIIANPADDAPRLIYADWLDEHGHEQLAAFIRWQIAGHRKGEKYITCDYIPEEQYGTGCDYGPVCYNRDFAEWFNGFCLSIVGDKTSWTWTWRRGFVEELIMPADAVWEHLLDLRKVHPITKVVVAEEPRSEVNEWLQQRCPTARDSNGVRVIWFPDPNRTPVPIGSNPAWQTRLRALFWPIVFEFRIPQRTYGVPRMQPVLDAVVSITVGTPRRTS